MKNNDIKFFLKSLGIEAKEISFYLKAFSHLSYVNEKKSNSLESYERQEFLGDSLLGFIVANLIFDNFPLMLPGDMSLLRSRLVNKVNLSKVAKRMNLEKYILLSSGGKKSVVSDSILADVVEALICAIYLDLGFSKARNFIKTKIYYESINEIDINNLKDYKTRLQEYFHANGNHNLEYRIEKKKIKEKELEFIVGVYYDKLRLSKGKGKSVKDAEQMAAKIVLEKEIKLKRK